MAESENNTNKAGIIIALITAISGLIGLCISNLDKIGAFLKTSAPITVLSVDKKDTSIVQHSVVQPASNKTVTDVEVKNTKPVENKIATQPQEDLSDDPIPPPPIEWYSRKDTTKK